MRCLALDPSKRSTGWALWEPGWEKPRHGHFLLGSPFTSDGRVFVNMHKRLDELRTISKFEAVYFEQPIHPAQLSGSTSIGTIRLAAGIAAHIESYAVARNCRVIKSVNVQKWRPDWIGKIHAADASARARRLKKAGDKRASARDELKALTMERARQFGFDPANYDEADAIAILDYSLGLSGVTPPWRAEEVLRPLLGMEPAA